MKVREREATSATYDLILEDDYLISATPHIRVTKLDITVDALSSDCC